MDLLYLLWLHQTEGLGPRKQKELLNRFGSARAVYEAGSADLKEAAAHSDPKLTETNVQNLLNNRDLSRAEKTAEDCQKKNIQVLTLGDAAYPSLLKEIHDPPVVLYMMGTMPDDDYPKVSLIGSRRCSEYGLTVARKLSAGLAHSHVVIVSGMARGIDSMAHKGALDAAGLTIAVLGCGVDVCYPAENWALRNRILSSGCILSEYSPGTQPQQGFFPTRNRIISGLCAVTVVVEAAKKSGTLITVGQALEQGREVMAVPGNLTSKLSEGTNDLIKDGAGMVTSAEDILNALGVPIRKELETPNIRQIELAPDEKLVYDTIKFQPVSSEEIVDKINLQAQTINYVLTMLELKGCVQKLPGQRYIRL